MAAGGTVMPARDSYADKSFWLEGEPYSEAEPLSGERQVDVAIVGGGFTGLATAHFLKRMEPSLNVALLEAQVIGYGASGRNAGFSMTLFGLSLSVTATLYGRERALSAHRYMEEAVETLENLVRDHEIDCDYERPGFLRVATTPTQVRRIQKELELADRMGIRDVEWLDAEQVRAEVDSPTYLGAWWEPRCGLVNPAKLARGMRTVVEGQGVAVHERSPVTALRLDGSPLALETPNGRLLADRAVLALNGYSHLLPQLRSLQVPAFTHIVLTEPLPADVREAIGWRQRQGIEDARSLVHYYRLTADDRLLMGGRDVTLAYGDDMAHDRNERTFRALEQDARRTFPQLSELRFTHRWGGPVSVPLQLVPALGHLPANRRVLYSLGCMGHGVSLTQLNGLTLAELLLERPSERTGQFFVDRRVLPWPGEPLRMGVAAALRQAFRADDAWAERRGPAAD